MLGLLTCRHRDKDFLHGGLDGLDPRIAAYITDAGLDGLLRVPHMDLDHALITALVERWRPETHSFPTRRSSDLRDGIRITRLQFTNDLSRMCMHC